MTIKGFKVPHFQVILGGKWSENGGTFGLAIGAVPSKNIPGVVTKITESFINERKDYDETLQSYVKRVGKLYMKSLIEPHMNVPTYEDDATYYSDWGDPREFSLGDMGVGECAGEIVTREEFELQIAERVVFEAQIALDEKNYPIAKEKSLDAMLQAARALIRIENYDVPNQPDVILKEFKARFYDTKLFYDKYAKGKFGRYLLKYFEKVSDDINEDLARQYVEESQLFIEASHACYSKISSQEE